MEKAQTLYDKALSIAADAHRGQKDLGGEPYILHPIRVSERCKTPMAKIAAVLHDVVEDTVVTVEDLMEAGFPDDVVSAVELLTRKDGESYHEYIDKISENSIATEVKLADLQENMDVTRLKKITDRDFERLKKYHASFVFLTSKTQCLK